MKVFEVSIEGFGPHDGPNRIILDGKRVLLTGPNGSGKTHILQAVMWCLFGDTGSLDPWISREEVLKDLENWSFEEDRISEVMVKFSIEGEKYRCKRKIKGNMEPEFFRLIKGRWKREKICPEIGRTLIPFILYQGESGTFLTADIPYMEKSGLFQMIDRISGIPDLKRAEAVISVIRKELLSDIEVHTKLNRAAQKRLKALRSEVKVIENELNELSTGIEDREKELKMSRSSYLEVIQGLTGPNLRDDVTKRRTEAAKETGMLIERLAVSWKNSPVEMLRPLAEPALKRSMERMVRIDQMKMMTGAVTAQISIVDEVLNRKSCICGTPIGKTGMGRERLSHLIQVLEEKRSTNSRWENMPIWNSRQFLGSIERKLAVRTNGGEGIGRDICHLKRSEKILKEVPASKKREEARDKLIEAIRDHERNKLILKEDRIRKEGLRKKMLSLDGEITDELAGMRVRGGFDVSEKRVNDILSLLNSAKDRVSELQVESIRSVLTSLAENASRSLSLMRPEMKERIVIHEETMQVGLERDGGSETRKIPLWRLSAGEREAVVLSIVLSISRMTGTNLILDSPVSNLEKDTMERSLDAIFEDDGVLLMVPQGTIDEGTISRIRDRYGPALNGYELKKGRSGSMLQEVK